MKVVIAPDSFKGSITARIREGGKQDETSSLYHSENSC